MASGSTYSTSELELKIDQSRLNNNWKSVIELVERYAQIFEVGAVSHTVSKDKSRAYYWTVMAEVMMYNKMNLEKASYCALKAAEFDPDTIQWKVVLVKVLLARFESVMPSPKRKFSKRPVSEEDTSAIPKPSQVDKTSYVNALQVEYDLSQRFLFHQ
jgi:hypothetical protein